MSTWRADPASVRRLVAKDWRLFRKKLAGYVGGLVVALALIGHGQPWTFSIGGLLLVILMAVMSSYSIQAMVLAERTDQTRAFVMSLPVSPADVYWGKLLANLLVYSVPFGLVSVGCTLLVLTTPLPDGLLVYMWLVFGFMAACYCVTLCIALALESGAWIAFWMMALMAFIGPFMFGAMRLPGVAGNLGGDSIVWSGAVIAVLAAEAVVVLVAIAVTSVVHGRRTSFL